MIFGKIQGKFKLFFGLSEGDDSQASRWNENVEVGLEREKAIIFVSLLACAFFKLTKLVLDGMENDLQFLAHILRIGQKVDDNIVAISQFTLINAIKKVGQICLVN